MAREDSMPAEWVGISPCADCRGERHLKWCYECLLWWAVCCRKTHVCDPPRRAHVDQLKAARK